MHMGDIAETNRENGIFGILGHVVTFIFDLSIPKNLITYLCPNMHYRQKFDENPLVHTADISETTHRRICGCTNMHRHTQMGW